MTTVIPEIRVYSPSDVGDDSNESDTGSRNSGMNRKPRPHIGHLGRLYGLDRAGRMFLDSPASRSGDAASSENSVSQPDDFRDVSSPSNRVIRNNNNPKKRWAHSDVTLVKWENTFHTRPFNLSNFPNTNAYRSTPRAQMMALNRARGGCISSSAKSLDILRQNLQRSINQDIDNIIQKYLTNYFRPGIQNINENNGENAVSEQHVHNVCRQILEDAKKMYHINSPVVLTHARGASPVDGLSDAENAFEVKQKKFPYKGPGRKRKESDTDSDASLINPKPKKRKGRPPLNLQGSPSGRSTPSKIRLDLIRREGVKWDPARLTPETEFIMGAKANKALGLGATRGRLYMKHPEVFKYSGDQDDKQWLYDHNLMPATGGKAYMLLVEDIRELAELDEYKNSSGLTIDEIVGFTVAETILAKMRVSMLSMRTDIVQPSKKRSRNVLAAMDSLSDQGSSVFTDSKLEDERGLGDMESRTVSPTDDLDMLSNDVNSTQQSPFSLGFVDASPSNPKDETEIGGSNEAPLSAPFDITCAPD